MRRKRSNKDLIREVNEDGLISEYYKPELDIIDLDILKKQKPQWFSFEALFNKQKYKEELDELNFYIINLQKNCGKTFWIIKETNKLTQQCIKDFNNEITTNNQFVLLFNNETILKARTKEINNNPDYEYYIKANVIYSKGRKEVEKYTNRMGEEDEREIWINRNIPLGFALPVATIGNFSSFQFSGVYNIFWDEYRNKTDLSGNQFFNQGKNFMIFIDNVQRAKVNVKFYLFGNNEAGGDPIAEWFKIDKKQTVFYWPTEKILYFNVPEIFTGLSGSERLAKRLGRFNQSYNNFINKNISMESDKGMTTLEHFNGSNFFTYFVLENRFYEMRIDNDNNYVVQSIEELEWLANRERKLTMGVLNEDKALGFVRIIDLSFIDYLQAQFSFNKLLFWKVNDRDHFSKLWKLYRGKIAKEAKGIIYDD